MLGSRSSEMIPPMRHKDRAERRLIQLLCGASARRKATASEVQALIGKIDVTTLVALLKRLNMLVLIGGRLLALGLRDMPELEHELESHSARGRGWGVVTEFTTLDVLDRLRALGIRAVPLKGSILARRLYRDVGARTSVDSTSSSPPRICQGRRRRRQELGWRWQPDMSRNGGLPLLHETLLHPRCPAFELHWRVHWYERQFAADAVARAVKPSADAPLEMQPMDGLITLMLFYARDGFAGLRYPGGRSRVVGLQVRWGQPVQRPSGARHRAVSEPRGAGLGGASLSLGARGRAGTAAAWLPFRWRVAAGLASPFLEGGRRQAEANAGFVRSSAGASGRRRGRRPPGPAECA